MQAVVGKCNRRVGKCNRRIVTSNSTITSALGWLGVREGTGNGGGDEEGTIVTEEDLS